MNKSDLYELLKEKKLNIRLMIQYQQRDIIDFHSIEKGLVMGLSKLLGKLKEEVRTSG